jgi:hypothetical protein
MSPALALEYKKSYSQFPGLIKTQHRAASTGEANKATQGLIHITGESSECDMTDTLEDKVNRQPFSAASCCRIKNSNKIYGFPVNMEQIPKVSMQVWRKELRSCSEDSDACVHCDSDER